MYTIKYQDGKTELVAPEDLGSLQAKADSIIGLMIDYENDIQDLHFLESFENLEELAITRCISVSDLRPISYLTKLKNLDLSSTGAIKIKDFSPIKELKALTKLQLAGMQFIVDLKFLEELVNIELLNFNFCYHLSDISPIEHMPRLVSFHVKDCFSLRPILPKLIKREFKDFTPP